MGYLHQLQFVTILTEVARHEFASSEECGVMGRTGHGVVLPWLVMI